MLDKGGYHIPKWVVVHSQQRIAASAITAGRAVVILLLMTSLSPSVAACPMLLNMALDSFNENKDLYTSLLVYLCGLLFPTSEWYVGHELREAEKQAIRHQSVLSSPSGLMWVLWVAHYPNYTQVFHHLLNQAVKWGVRPLHLQWFDYVVRILVHKH